MEPQRKTPLLLVPFVLIWSLFSFMLKLTGRVVAAIVGLILMMAGIALSVTFFAAPIGIPIAIFGFLLMLRSVL